MSKSKQTRDDALDMSSPCASSGTIHQYVNTKQVYNGTTRDDESIYVSVTRQIIIDLLFDVAIRLPPWRGKYVNFCGLFSFEK